MRRFFELKSWYSILWRLTAPREGKGIFGESQLASLEYSLEVGDGWKWQILGWYQFLKNRSLNLLILKITIAHFLRVCLSKTAQSQTKAPCRYPCTISSDSILNPQQKRESTAQWLAPNLRKTLFSLKFSWI
jgi:hypothetical protein